MVNLKLTTKYGAMASAVFASIVIGGFYFVRQRSQRKEEPPKLMRSMSMAVLHGGKLALKRLLEYHKTRADKDADNVICDLTIHLFKKKPPDYKKLESIVAKIEMTGKEDKAAEMLEQAKIMARKEQKWHEAYETEMLLVEMLIYKGDYEKALKCECLSELSHYEISDARRPLYKAIIYIMSSEHAREEIKDEWKKFHDLNQEFHCEPSENEAQHKLLTDFDEFEKVVKVLKEDIEAQAMKRKK